jgi:hypothetical protein
MCTMESCSHLVYKTLKFTCEIWIICVTNITVLGKKFHLQMITCIPANTVCISTSINCVCKFKCFVQHPGNLTLMLLSRTYTERKWQCHSLQGFINYKRKDTKDDDTHINPLNYTSIINNMKLCYALVYTLLHWEGFCFDSCLNHPS